jgi:nucleotide-binding universal stress UspA family protein
MSAALPDWKSATQPRQIKSETSIKSIVVPLDSNESSRTAFPVARALAELYGAALHVTYVGEGRFDVKETARQLGLRAEPAHGVIFEEGSGDLAEFVSQRAQQLPEALLVMSSEVGAPTQSNRFGSLTELVLRAKPQRVVLSTPERGRRAWNPGRILLAHDGTPISNSATKPAADLAQRAGAEVIALHVAARGEERPEAPGSIAAPLYVDQPQHEWPAWAEEFMNRVVAGGGLSAGLRFQLKVTGGQAGSEVAEVARERKADLVIMAWHGHWAEHEDCATRVVVRNAGCPVLLVYSAGEVLNEKRP